MKLQVALEPFNGVIDPSFKCRSEEFTNFYLHELAGLAEARILAAFIAKDIQTGKVMGYITMSAKEIRKEEIGGEGRFSMWPMTLVGMLATHVDYENRGIGRTLVAHAFVRAMNAAEDVGSGGLLVEAIPGVEDYYVKMGFVHCNTTGKNRRTTKLFLPFPKKSE